MKVALMSDLHFDVNGISPEETLNQRADFLAAQGVQYVINGGDTYNSFEKTITYMERLQAALPDAKVYFIAGNHEMVHDVSYEQLESPLSDLYLHHRWIDIPGTDWRIIGNNGWYDYGFASNLVGRDFAQWKRAFWIDSSIEQPMTDPERMAIVLQQVEGDLNLAQLAHKRVLFVTHFVPDDHYIRYTSDNRFWNMANALMGSPRMGVLLRRYGTSVVLFGHMHIHPEPLKIDQTTFYDQALGYGTSRLHEWQQPDFMTEWQNRLKIIDLDKKSIKRVDEI
ncbi:metallophosphoesterase [Levilactobacillus bambusae]|uniref:Phosphoesterase n=1 Tax=Levilactobacillus bambusae TaxID=2024736 RepID=A0A2V1MXS9_9LACO|nr:metallophosphoesterase [Levilactobacillus bambusae]PWF99347.1 phosphoesterase [Levilactobacillus bambusae]